MSQLAVECSRVRSKNLSKRQTNADLRGERDADGGAGTEEIAEGACGNQKLFATRHGLCLRARWIETDGGDIRRIVHRENRDVRHVIRAWIIAVEEIEKLDERGGRPAFMKSYRPAD